MAKIRPLSEDLIGKIAAGEVVERPAAAIKELVENSLDAGATAVTVEIRDGGLSYIRVSDNGCGIEESDIRMAFERHATSKISTEKDLNAISTLGFRGEALASIAAVSKISMTTRTTTSEVGLKIRNEGGKITQIEEAACPVGTTIVVNDLFFNVPVRKGFMKKSGQEASAVHELMTQLLLSRPDVSFRYISNGKTEFHSPGDGQTATALHTVYGSKAVRSMREINDHGNGLLIQGYIGIGENARGNRNHEFFFINGRVMHSKVLNDAVENACRERVMIGKFPVCALYITIAYEAVDVNVHPNKLEVRFRDESAVYETVFSAALTALREKDAFERPVEMQLNSGKDPEPETKRPENTAERIPCVRKPLPQQTAEVSVVRSLPPEARQPLPETKPVPDYREAVQPPPVNAEQGPHAAEFPDRTVPDLSVPCKPDKPENPDLKLREKAEQVDTILPAMKKPMKVFGAVFSTYIMVEYEDQLLLVDQHAVHERLLFDELMKKHEADLSAGQELLVPVVIHVTGREQKMLEENRQALESIGMVAEPFGERDIAIRTIPVILGDTQAKEFLRDVIDQLESGHDPSAEKKRTMLLQTACKHAVKGGEPLSEDQLRSLLDQMIGQQVTPTCPHGRPLVVSISHRELDRKFKRIQK